MAKQELTWEQEKAIERIKKTDPKATIKRCQSGAISITYLQAWQKAWKAGGAAKATPGTDQTRYTYAILPAGELIGYTYIKESAIFPKQRKQFADALALITRPTKATKAKQAKQARRKAEGNSLRTSRRTTPKAKQTTDALPAMLAQANAAEERRATKAGRTTPKAPTARKQTTRGARKAKATA